MNHPRTQFRRKAYGELSRLLAKLDPPSRKSLSQDELQLLGIECTHMALLPQGRRDPYPLFCKLVPAKVIDEAFERTFEDEDTIPSWPGPGSSDRFYSAYWVGLTLLEYTWSGQEIQEPLVPNPKWRYTGDSTSALTKHRHFYPDTRCQWGTVAILRANDIPQPHLACVLMDEAPSDEDLRPSELISAVRLMKQAIRLDKLNQFRVNPVYVYSFCSYQARILETYYEAGTFFVRKTPYIDFEGEDKEKIKLYLRWMLSEPSGNTTFDTAEDSDDGHGGTRDTESSATGSPEE